MIPDKETCSLPVIHCLYLKELEKKTRDRNKFNTLLPKLLRIGQKSCVFKIKNRKKIYSWTFLEQNRTFTVQQLHLLTAPSYLDRPTYLIEYMYSILFSYFWYSTVISRFSVIKTLLHTFYYCHLHFVFLYSC